MDPERTKVVIKPAENLDQAPSVPPEPEEIHTLCVDQSDPRYNTPDAVLKGWAEDQERLPEPATVIVTPSYKPFKAFANIEVAPAKLTTAGLALNFTVNCNPAHMCTPHDLVPVFLEAQRGNVKHRFMVVLLRPAWPVTSFAVEVTYTLPQLAAILRVASDGLSMEKLRLAILDEYSEAALIAQWLAEKEGRPSPNSPNHESGGLLQKGGSGKIPFVPITLEALQATELDRNSEWNMGEKLRPGRPVFNRHRTLLAVNEEMSSTLEAESEYMIDESGLDKIIGLLKKLTGDEARWSEFGLVHMSMSVKTYTDEYFDFDDLYLLKNRIVLRRRSVTSDAPGTYLFSCKGKVLKVDQEVLRIGAQVRLVQQVAEGSDGPKLLAAFLADDKTDNAVTRVLHDALGNKKSLLVGSTAKPVTCVMTVVSERHKFAMKRADGTVIEFSADKATGTSKAVGSTIPGGLVAKCASFEFGVGHPGLNAAATAGPQIVLQKAKPTHGNIAIQVTSGDHAERASKFGTQTKGNPKIVRPYHVPSDLNKALVTKSDYAQYVALRDLMMAKLFEIHPDALARGGNKARVLAILMGLLND